MSKRLGQRSGKSKQETRQLPPKEHDDALAAEDKARQRVPSDSLRALIERALTDAEQIVASIKTKAQKEAEDEATRIINQARQSADEIRKRAEVAQKQAEDTLSVLDIKAEEVKKTKEVKKRAEKEVKPAAKESTLEKPVPLEKGATVSEPTEAIREELAKRRSPKERPGEGEPVSAPLKLDKQALYDGEVELTITTPIDPAAVSKLYNQLQMTPEIKILYTRGSWDQGTTITVSLDRPLPLIGIISRTPGVEVTPGSPQKDKSEKGQAGSLLGATKKGVKRIALTLKAR
jgi:hypothetical protein